MDAEHHRRHSVVNGIATNMVADRQPPSGATPIHGSEERCTPPIA
jgi:hypothetical protein